MRKVLFRGKDIVSGEWRYGHLTQLEVNGKIATLIITDNIAEKSGDVAKDAISYTLGKDMFMVDESTVGQYVGSDFNGVYIYEGDVFKYKQNLWTTYVCVVVYAVDTHRFEILRIMDVDDEGGFAFKPITYEPNFDKFVHYYGTIHDINVKDIIL